MPIKEPAQADQLQNGGADSWKVGSLAASTGLTVRALHHYDHIGLLRPSSRSSVGHRLYTAEDVTRLYRISLLRQLGFPLEQIAHVLDDPNWDLQTVVQRHLTDTQRRADIAASLCTRLSDMAAERARHDGPGIDQMFGALEEMTMLGSTVHSTTALLVYDDLAAAHEYLVRVFGLTAGDVERNAGGTVVHAEVRAGDHVIWLHPAGHGYQSPQTLGAATGMTVLVVDDVDGHHARTVAAGGIIIEEPVDQNYGVREYGARDPEGQLWFFHSPVD
jgi:DNA-binding transcriptional MerR regulator/uncharacterized glyoxalase superfamily protein PhnB